MLSKVVAAPRQIAALRTSNPLDKRAPVVKARLEFVDGLDSGIGSVRGKLGRRGAEGRDFRRLIAQHLVSRLELVLIAAGIV